MAEQTILIVEDDPDIRDGVRILLAGEGYHILEAENGLRALELFDPEVDLVILDIMMPGMSGLRVCEELRKTSAVPILFLTAKSQESDKLLGLTAGGDDYLAKPFSFAELSARVKALLRRYCVYQGKDQVHHKPHNTTLELHGVRLALDCNRVWVDEREVDLTETEYKILRLLMQNPQRIFSIQVIYETVWNEPYYYVSNGTVMVHIRNLRMKGRTTRRSPPASALCGARATALFPERKAVYEKAERPCKAVYGHDRTGGAGKRAAADSIAGGACQGTALLVQPHGGAAACHPETGAGAAELCDGTSSCQHGCKGTDGLEP